MTPPPLLPPKLVLASSSRYRQALLARLGLPFNCQSPAIDETPLANESPAALTTRLATEKAQAVAVGQGAHGLIIASDQVASLGRQILGKPGSAEAAIDQLSRCSGQQLRFYTALFLLDTGTERDFHRLVTTDVQFRPLSQPQIRRYVDREQPLDCAGSFKAEGLGISLFTAIRSSDPTALIGLPLIALCDGLVSFGIELP